MLGKIDRNPPLDMFKTPLVNFINKNHELVHLAHQINWQEIEDEFAPLYSETGSPSIPIRKIGGLLILKRMFNESDESVIQRWIENPYWQYFCGEIYFQDEAPFDSTSFVHFRDRIGEDGFEFLLQHSIEEEQRNKNIKTVAIDPTVQPKNITYPTDSKLHDMKNH